MTREEAIDILWGKRNLGKKTRGAIEMAIKALEQEPCDEYGNYRYPGDIELSEPNTATSIPCGDAISRQAVLVSIKNLYPDMPIVDILGARRKWLEKYAPYFECENVVEQLPSVNPQEPRTGHWILKRTFPTTLYDENLNEYKCSECYREIRCTESQLVNYPYCHCGAKMIEPQESEE